MYIKLKSYRLKLLKKINRSTIENILGITFGISLFKVSFKNQFC